MAKVVMRAGKVIVVISLLLGLSTLLFLTVFSNAQEDNSLINTSDSAPMDSDNEKIILSNIKSELTEYRNYNKRIWTVTKEILSKDILTDEPVIDEVCSNIVEVGDAICYKDDLGNLVTHGWLPLNDQCQVDRNRNRF